jgi:hypothetical protein
MWCRALLGFYPLFDSCAQDFAGWACLRARACHDDAVEVLLSRWEKLLGLMGDIRVPLGDLDDVQLVRGPLRQAPRRSRSA